MTENFIARRIEKDLGRHLPEFVDIPADKPLFLSVDGVDLKMGMLSEYMRKDLRHRLTAVAVTHTKTKDRRLTVADIVFDIGVAAYGHQIIIHYGKSPILF
jgi:hypothetical protein